MMTYINMLPNRLNIALKNLISDISESKNVYFCNQNIQDELSYLSGWFDSRTEVLNTWVEPFLKGAKDNEYLNSDEYSHYLMQPQSIAQGFDVDLTWSNGSRRVEIGALLVSSIAKSILFYLSNSDQFEKELNDSIWLEKTWTKYKHNPELVEDFD